MKLDDLIALAKSGYSVADVKELLSLNTPNEANVPTEGVNPTTDDNDKLNNEPVEVINPNQNDASPIDYKLKYEEILEKVGKLEEDLKTAQSKNISSPINEASNNSVDTILDEILF